MNDCNHSPEAAHDPPHPHRHVRQPRTLKPPAASWLAAGLHPQDIDIVDQEDWAQGASGEPVRRDGGEHKGFFRSLKDMIMPDADRQAYSEGLERGHYLLTAQMDEDRCDAAAPVLERSNPVDLPSQDRADRRPAEQRTLGDDETGITTEPGPLRVRSYSILVVREVPDEDTDYLRP